MANADVKVAQTVKEIEQAMLGPKKTASGQDDIEIMEDEYVPAEKKPLGRLGVALLVSLAWMAVLFIAVLFVMNDPTPQNTVRNWVLMKIMPESKTWEEMDYSVNLWDKVAEEYYGGDIMKLQEQWMELREAQREFEEEKDEWEDEMEEREDELDEWEDRLDEREARLNEMLEGGGGIITPDIAQTASTVQRMDPAQAAASLLEMDDEYALMVCMLISPKKLAPIFDSMEPEEAAGFLDAMSEPSDDWDDECENCGW
jgi:flagellar motility protein MotE (MotC chaperone)